MSQEFWALLSWKGRFHESCKKKSMFYVEPQRKWVAWFIYIRLHGGLSRQAPSYNANSQRLTRQLSDPDNLYDYIYALGSKLPFFSMVGMVINLIVIVGVYIHIRIPYKSWDEHPEYEEFRPWRTCSFTRLSTLSLSIYSVLHNPGVAGCLPSTGNVHADHVARATLQPFLQAVGDIRGILVSPWKIGFCCPFGKGEASWNIYIESTTLWVFMLAFAEVVDIALMTSLFYNGCTFN